MEIVLTPVQATVDVMESLEAHGVITRLGPAKHRLSVNRGESKWRELYAADSQFGPHKLICVTINDRLPRNFVYHSVPEEFLLIDDPRATPLILTVSLLTKDELEQKIQLKTVTSADFLALQCVPNHPELSFFTMNPFYPHVETCLLESESPPSFYVTESKNIDEMPIRFETYQLTIKP